MSLWNKPVADITYEDVADFCREKFKESRRVEYKGDVPRDLDASICAKVRRNLHQPTSYRWSCKMNWTVTGNQIKASNGNQTTFEFDIRETTKVDDVLIVILKVPPKHVMTENVFGVSPEGKLLWQIERTAANSTDPENRYLGVTGHDDHTARIYNWNGTNSGVDVHSGKVLDTQVTK